MKGYALMAAFSLASLSAATDILSALRANKAACSDAEALITGSGSFGPSKSLPAEMPGNKVQWYGKGDSSLAIVAGNDGKLISTFLIKDGQSYTIDHLAGPGNKVHINIDRSFSGNDGALNYGLKAGRYWFADLVLDGFIKPVGPYDPKADLAEFQGVLPSGSTCRVWFKPSAGCLAVHAVFKNPGTGGTSDCVTDQWQRIGEAVFPRHAVTFRDSGRNSEVRYVRDQVSISEVKLGGVPDSRFELPALTVGSQIKDDKALKMWEIGPNGERLFKGYVNQSQPSGTGPTMLGWIIVLGVAGTSLAAIFWMRKRIGISRSQG